MLNEIVCFDYKNACADDYESLNAHCNDIQNEERPNDPPRQARELMLTLKNIPGYIKSFMWVVWNSENDAIIASASLNIPLEDNLHLAQCLINVQSDSRRKGYAKALFAKVVEVAKHQGRELLITNTTDRMPAGAVFMEILQAERGLQMHTNQLDVDNLNQGMIKDWLNISDETLKQFELIKSDGLYPQENMDSIIALHDLFNQQPLGSLDLEKFTFSEEHIQQTEKALFARDHERWTVFVKDKKTGKFAGYSEMTLDPNIPTIVRQGLTGVFPEYRNQGLGKWLKAEMLSRVIGELPQVKYIRTENAVSNGPMLKINEALGFQRYIVSTIWQVPVSRVEEYIER